MAQTPLEIEREIDLIHVTCGYHCSFKGYTEDKAAAFYECGLCKFVFMVGALPTEQQEETDGQQTTGDTGQTENESPEENLGEVGITEETPQESEKPIKSKHKNPK